MNPNQIAVVYVLEHLLGEFAVHVPVVLPPGGLVTQVVRQVMQQRPDARVRKTFVMRLDILFTEKHRHAAIFFCQNALDLPLP